MSKTKNPAIQPGEGARAIDTFRNDYIASGKMFQAQNALKAHQLRHLASGFNYLEECCLMMAFLAGYAPDMPLGMAHEIITELARERNGIA